MRVLLDVNILVCANENSDGLARKLLLQLLSGRHVILTSTEILMELVRVLRYPRMQALFGLAEEQIYEYVQFLKGICQIVPVDMTRNFPIRDLADTPVLRAAIAGEADFLCTLDTDFYTSEIKNLCSLVALTVLDDIALIHRLRR